MSCHEGRLKRKGTLGKKKSNIHIPDSEVRKANFTVLENAIARVQCAGSSYGIIHPNGLNNYARLVLLKHTALCNHHQNQIN